MPILSNLVPTIATPRNIDLAVMSIDPRRAWTALTFIANNRLFANSFRVNRAVSVSQVTVHVQAQAGNLDLGLAVGDDISNLTRLASTGSFACPAAGITTQNLTTTVVLLPGQRYWGLSATDTSTAALYGVFPTVAAAQPLFQAAKISGSMATAFPIPAVITLDNTLQTRPHFMVFS